MSSDPTPPTTQPSVQSEQASRSPAPTPATNAPLSVGPQATPPTQQIPGPPQGMAARQGMTWVPQYPAMQGMPGMQGMPMQGGFPMEMPMYFPYMAVPPPVSGPTPSGGSVGKRRQQHAASGPRVDYPMGSMGMPMPFFMQPPMGPRPVYQSVEPRERLKHQLGFYFSAENLLKDVFLISKSDESMWVHHAVLAQFPRVQRLLLEMGKPAPFVLEVLSEIDFVEVSDSSARPKQFELFAKPDTMFVIGNNAADVVALKELGGQAVLSTNDLVAFPPKELAKLAEKTRHLIQFPNPCPAMRANQRPWVPYRPKPAPSPVQMVAPTGFFQQFPPATEQRHGRHGPKHQQHQKQGQGHHSHGHGHGQSQGQGRQHHHHDQQTKRRQSRRSSSFDATEGSSANSGRQGGQGGGRRPGSSGSNGQSGGQSGGRSQSRGSRNGRSGRGSGRGRQSDGGRGRARNQSNGASEQQKKPTQPPPSLERDFPSLEPVAASLPTSPARDKSTKAASVSATDVGGQAVPSVSQHKQKPQNQQAPPPGPPLSSSQQSSGRSWASMFAAQQPKPAEKEETPKQPKE
eukprot:m.286990 g.286990  ORF g.286990 m.286990 type:complete len:572 (+) comp15786_c1_seq2:416-2131(+)